MRILLVAATAAEILPFVNTLDIVDESQVVCKRYHKKNIRIDALVTGIGMTATAFYLGKILLTSYDLAINAGIAGCFRREFELGAVLNVTRDQFPELGAEDHDSFLSLSELKLQHPDDFPYSDNTLKNTTVINSSTVETLPKVNGITVNTVHGNALSIDAVVKRFSPITESMEGAAFLLACLTEKIPCVQIRAISNYMEPRNRAAWNIPLAIKNLNSKLVEITNEFINQDGKA